MKASLSEFNMAELMGLARRAKDKVVALNGRSICEDNFRSGRACFCCLQRSKG